MCHSDLGDGLRLNESCSKTRRGSYPSVDSNPHPGMQTGVHISTAECGLRPSGYCVPVPAGRVRGHA